MRLPWSVLLMARRTLWAKLNFIMTSRFLAQALTSMNAQQLTLHIFSLSLKGLLLRERA